MACQFISERVISRVHAQATLHHCHDVVPVPRAQDDQITLATTSITPPNPDPREALPVLRKDNSSTTTV